MRAVFLRVLTAILIGLGFLLDAGTGVGAEEISANEPTRYGLAVAGGNTYRGESLSYGLVTALALFDYDKIWPHRAPEALRFKVELSAGTSTHPDTRLMASANMFALYYLRPLETRVLRPYVEGGIGVIYTDFKLKGQGLRFNFNPQIGLGTDIKIDPRTEFFAAARLHHVSNAGLDDENRGINSVLLTIGYYFE